MPPRKSDAAKVATGDEGTPSVEKTQVGIPIEDLNLPKSIVTRLAKGVLPANTQIQGNATLALQKSATVFVNHLANAANTHAQRAQRKTIAPQDVFQALEADLEFADFIPRLEAELAKFNEISTEKRNTYRKKVAADKAAGKTGSGDHEDGDGDDTVDEGARDESGQPATKKARRADGDGRKGAATRDMEIADEGGDENEEEGNDNEEADEDEDEGEEHFQVEEDALEEPEEKEGVDEALDNGEDSD